MTRMAIRAGLFEPNDDPSTVRLLGGFCPACRRHHFPAESLCPFCGTDACERLPLSRNGTLLLCTTVVSRPPGYDGPVPYGFGIVELPEGIRIISRIVDANELAPGTAVELTFEPVGIDDEGREIVTYAFRKSPHEPQASHE